MHLCVCFFFRFLYKYVQSCKYYTKVNVKLSGGMKRTSGSGRAEERECRGTWEVCLACNIYLRENLINKEILMCLMRLVLRCCQAFAGCSNLFLKSWNRVWRKLQLPSSGWDEDLKKLLPVDGQQEMVGWTVHCFQHPAPAHEGHFLYYSVWEPSGFWKQSSRKHKFLIMTTQGVSLSHAHFPSYQPHFVEL